MFLICSLICFLNERCVAIIHKYSLKTFSIYWVKVTDCTWLTCEHRHNTDTVYFLLFLMFFTQQQTSDYVIAIIEIITKKVPREFEQCISY